MKKMILIAAALILGLASCDKENREKVISEGNGGVTIGLERSGEFTQTKTEDDLKVNVADFYVKILKDGVVVDKCSFEKYSDVPSAIELAPGTYTIEAGTHGQADAAFDQPIYLGTGTFTIKVGEVIPVNLTCTLQNMKVTIRYTETFGREIADDFEIAVTNGTSNLIFTKTIIDGGKSGYFKPGNLSLKLNGKRKLSGEEVLHSADISNGKAKDHFVFTFDAQETGEVEIGQSGITIDYTVNNRNENIVVPGEDDDIITPDDDEDDNGSTGGDDNGSTGGGSGSGDNGSTGEDKPVNEYLPTITGPGIGTPVVLDLNSSEEEIEAMSVIINIAALNGKTIDDIFVTITSNPTTLQDLAALMMKFEGRFSIVNFANTEYDNIKKQNLINLGLIPSNKSIKGETSYPFNISQFMSALADVMEAGGTCNFKLEVVDSEGKSTEAVCVVNIIPKAQ